MKHLIKERSQHELSIHPSSSKKNFPFNITSKKSHYSESKGKSVIEQLSFRTPVHSQIRGMRTLGNVLISIVDSGPGVSEVSIIQIAQTVVQ